MHYLLFIGALAAAVGFVAGQRAAQVVVALGLLFPVFVFLGLLYLWYIG
jgi:hypothetical protein